MKHTKGFTLIELMIVVAIIAIISAIAYPSYKDSVTKTKRADAKVSLTTLAANLERCMTINGQYTTTTTPAKTCSVVDSSGALVSTASDKGYYTLGITVTATTFSITATPSGFTDSKCNVFTLTNDGVKTASGTDGNSKCWN